MKSPGMPLLPHRSTRRKDPEGQTKGGSEMLPPFGGLSAVIPGRCESIELRCAIAHRRISRFRVRRFAPPRNDEVSGSLAEHLVNVFPVDQAIAERLQIVGTAVAIIDVVGVLPDVAAENRRCAVDQRALAVRGLGDFELAVLDRHPAPAGAELADAGGGEIGLELLETA